jgi:hypothetical protein
MSPTDPLYDDRLKNPNIDYFNRTYMSSLKKANVAIPSQMPTDNLAFCHSANEVDRKIITNFCKFQKVEDILNNLHPALCETRFSPRKLHKKEQIRKAFYSFRKALIPIKSQNLTPQKPLNWLNHYSKISLSRRPKTPETPKKHNNAYKTLSTFALKASFFDTESSDHGPSEVNIEKNFKGKGRKQLEAYINGLNQFMGKIRKEGQILSKEKEERQKR